MIQAYPPNMMSLYPAYSWGPTWGSSPYSPISVQPGERKPMATAMPDFVPLKKSQSHQLVSEIPAFTQLAHHDDDGHDHDGHDHQAAPLTPAQKGIKLLTAAAFITAGILLGRIFPKNRNLAGVHLVSSDWKDWARIALGVSSVGKINSAFGWTPPPWLLALETSALIHPLAVGISRLSLAQFAVLAPIVTTVVQSASALNKTFSKDMKEQFNVPPLASQLAISGLMVFLGMKAYPFLFEKASKGVAHLLKGAGRAMLNKPHSVPPHVKFLKSLGFKPKELLEQAKHLQKASQTAGASVIVCGRGCCQGSVICLSEIGELFGGIGNWYRFHVAKKEQTP